MGETVGYCFPMGECDSAAWGQRCCKSDGTIQSSHGLGPGSDPPATNASNVVNMCGCRTGNNHGTSISDGLLIMHLVFAGILISVVAILFCRGRRPRDPPSRAEHDFERRMREAKAALVPVPPDPTATCYICLEPLKGRVVRPANCDHAAHKDCLTTWIEQVSVEVLKRADEAARDCACNRMLSCPLCNRPICATGHDEEIGVQYDDDDDDASLSDDASLNDDDVQEVLQEVAI